MGLFAALMCGLACIGQTGLNALYIFSDIQLELISGNNVNLKTNFWIPKLKGLNPATISNENGL